MLIYPCSREILVMSQLTIYLDEASMRDVKKAAKREHISVSLWARKRLCRDFRHTWPNNYFELFGALRDSDLVRPTQGDMVADINRKAL